MNEFKVPEPKKVKVTIGDKFYEVAVPKIGQSRDLEAKLKEEGGKAIDSMIELMVKLGLPEEESLNMEQDSFLELFTYISSLKKN